ncbi:MAG: NYN domain-containing protein [Clostridiales bacterium]|jgi:hypothetical protein|nr:NYN domain-containing protein [Clostridiales bacterium]
MEIVDKTIALLIDSDNISKDYFTILMEELDKFGTVTYRRIYGDFNSPNTSGWRPLLLEFAIEPIQQYAYVTGKNATDSAMIIDAMDILYTGNVNCICLATSDSDFTKLAIRFRNANYTVIGAGEQKTPQPFRAACHQFLLMDTLLAATKQSARAAQAKEKESAPVQAATAAKKTAVAKAAPETPKGPRGLIENPQGVLSLKKLIALVKDIIKEYDGTDDADGWAHYGTVIQALMKRDNTFTPRNYGYQQRLINFFRDLPGKPFTIEVGNGKQRIKANK